MLPWSTEPVAIIVYLALGATLVELLRRTDPPEPALDDESAAASA